MLKTDPSWVLFQWTTVEPMIGVPERDVPLFIIKETIDNFLDAAEDQRVDPIIDIQMDHGTDQQVNLSIKCNTHYSPKAIRAVYSAEFGERVSTKTFVKLPSRGLFGMASKTIQALPYTLSLRYGVGLPEQPPIVISTAYGGLVHEFEVGANVNARLRKATPICRKTATTKQNGTWTTFSISFPANNDVTRMIDGFGEPESLEIPPKTHLFYPISSLEKLIALLSGYAYLNPNLTMTVRIGKASSSVFKQTRVAMRKRSKLTIFCYSADEFRNAFYGVSRSTRMNVRQFVTGCDEWPGFSGFSSYHAVSEVLKGAGTEGAPYPDPPSECGYA